MDDDDEFLAAEEAAQSLNKSNYGIPSGMPDERARREEEEAYDQARVPVVPSDTLISIDDSLTPNELSTDDLHIPPIIPSYTAAPLSVLNATDESQLSSFPAISIRPRTMQRSAVAAAVASARPGSAATSVAATVLNSPLAPFAPPITEPRHPLTSPSLEPSSSVWDRPDDESGSITRPVDYNSDHVAFDPLFWRRSRKWARMMHIFDCLVVHSYSIEDEWEKC
ncbi:hypothetical protein BC829DRAFT_419179 [Chytridium lagenaria]|nr:hypothetical protein BC829DRAFT_419179 [Chytridium lagenaria]